MRLELTLAACAMLSAAVWPRRLRLTDGLAPRQGMRHPHWLIIGSEVALRAMMLAVSIALWWAAWTWSPGAVR
jgi:hypothetical protein